jgi:outer membrane protein assembly factor BamB
VNGVSLTYNSTNQDYEGDVVVAPGGSVNLSVTVDGVTYTASGTQFNSYPTISAPQPMAIWSSALQNVVSWSGGTPVSNAQYGIGVLDAADPNGSLVWPGSGFLDLESSGTSSLSIPSFSLSKGNRHVVVGLLTSLNIPGAAPGSGLDIGGFSRVPIGVVNGMPTGTLLSIAVTPAVQTVLKGATRQFVATGIFSDNSTLDLADLVTWTSSDTAKIGVSVTGLVTGVDFGSAAIHATFGSISGSALVTVFQSNPSPSPPLSQSVAYQIDYAHAGRATFGTPITFPSNAAWSVTLNGPVSYPVIVDGKVFVTTGSGGNPYGTTLYALNEQTGSVVWGPLFISGTYFRSGHAYDHGKLFVINYDGLLRSFDAATGQAGWSTQLPGQSAFSSPPTAVNGIVYVGGAGLGGTLYAVDESNGSVIWTAAVANGDQSSPTVSADGVFVSYPCQVYKFDPITGSSRWHYSGQCNGGGGRTSVYANGLLYVRDEVSSVAQIFDAATGNPVGTFNAPFPTPIPAFSTQTGFFQSAGTLQGVDLNTHSALWSFTGDGALVSAPIVINEFVIVGSSSGNVYALDAATGSPIWSKNAGGAIAGPDEHNVSQSLTGFGAGEGYLIVPAGNVLTAWHLTGP